MSDYLLPLAVPGPVRRRRSSVARTVRVEVGARSAWFHGTGVAAVMDELGVPRMRDWHPDRKGILMCAVNRVDDVLALIEHRDGRLVDLVAVDR